MNELNFCQGKLEALLEEQRIAGVVHTWSSGLGVRQLTQRWTQSQCEKQQKSQLTNERGLTDSFELMDITPCWTLTLPLPPSLPPSHPDLVTLSLLMSNKIHQHTADGKSLYCHRLKTSIYTLYNFISKLV